FFGGWFFLLHGCNWSFFSCFRRFFFYCFLGLCALLLTGNTLEAQTQRVIVSQDFQNLYGYRFAFFEFFLGIDALLREFRSVDETVYIIDQSHKYAKVR